MRQVEMLTVTSAVADFIANTSYSDLPDDVIAKAKLWLLDAIGCGLGGSQTPLSKSAVNSLSETSTGDAKVIGRDVTVDIGTSAFLNAMSINALDYDDSNPSGHPSSTVVGTLLSLCSLEQATGRGFLLSYIVGYDISSRVGQAVFPSADRFSKAFGIGTHQTFGAVAAAAKFRNLGLPQVLNALGIAGASAPVPSAQKWGWDNRPLTWVKDAVALPAQVGVSSTTLAAGGFLGCKDILDGDTGFWQMMGSDRCDADLMTRDLGKDFFIMNGSIKTYACCWFIHPTLDAIKTILGEHDLTHEDIAQIDVWSLTELYHNFNFIEPSEMVDAQFSLPYCVAVMLLGIETGPKWVDYALFSDRSVLSIASKVKIHADSAADHIFHAGSLQVSAKVAITTVSGERLEASAAAPRGTPYSPISDQEIADKYLRMAVPVIGLDKAAQIQEIIQDLEHEGSMSPLTELIST